MPQCTRILIVEDDSVIRESLQQILENQGYHADTAADGGEALDHLKKTAETCLVLLDLMMPKVNGWEFLKIRMSDERLKRVPVVVFSAGGDSVNDIRSQGAELLRKPIKMDQLFTLVQKYCGPGRSA